MTTGKGDTVEDTGTEVPFSGFSFMEGFGMMKQDAFGRPVNTEKNGSRGIHDHSILVHDRKK